MTIKYTKNYHHLTHITTFYTLLYYNTTFNTKLIKYNHTFLIKQNTSNINLNQYNKNNPTIPNIYNINIYINNQPIINQNITFITIKKKKNTQTYITLKNLLQFHINSPNINNKKTILLTKNKTLNNYLNLTKIIPQTSIHYNINNQHLNINIPQT